MYACLLWFQVVLGGGQDASAVTTTDHRAGKFEAKFFDKVISIFDCTLTMLTFTYNNQLHFLTNHGVVLIFRSFKKKLEV